MDHQRLFSDGDIYNILENQKEAIKKEVYALDSNYLLNTSENDLVQWLIDRLRLDVPEILDSEIYVAEHKETKVDVSRDPMRWIDDRSEPFYVQGTRTTIAVPFSGDSGFFKVRPSSFSTVLPRANINGSELRMTFDQVEANGEAIKAQYTSIVSQIKQYLGWLSESANQFNNTLESVIRTHVTQRKEKLLAGAGMIESLGLPIKRREDAPTTYAVPVSRQRPHIEKPKATSSPFKPEPTLPSEEYEKILSIMKNMVLVMEKSPHAFEDMDEEALRTHFLVQLNAQYEGQATGETFNYKGKTDILISFEGKNVFIAECKFWKGEQAFLDTIDQLVDRYLSWRDTKTAVLVFNRNQNFTEVLSTIKEAAPKHSKFKRVEGILDDTTFRYVFHQADDANREIQLTVMAFNIPTKKKQKVTK